MRNLGRPLRPHWKYPFTPMITCTVPVELLVTLTWPEPSVARRAIPLFARVCPALKLRVVRAGIGWSAA